MAKRVGNIYLPNCNYTCLYNAYRKAAKGKRYRGDVLQFTDNLEGNLLALLDDLKNHTYTVGAYREFYVYEPKKRLIMALPFRDRVAQWWVYSLLYPIFDKTFIEDSYACRRGKGQKAATWVMNWLEIIIKPGIKERTYINYKASIEKHIIPGIGRYKLKDITDDVIQKYLNDQQEHGNLKLEINDDTGEAAPSHGPVAASSLIQQRRLIIAALEYAVDKGRINRNPGKKTRRPKSKPKTNNILTDEEMETLGIKGTKYRYYPVYMLTLTTACRRGEILGLDWQHVDIGIPWTTVDRYFPWGDIKKLPKWDTIALKTLLEDHNITLGDGYLRLVYQMVDDNGTPFRDELKTDLSRRSLMITEEMVLLLIFWRLIQNTEKRKATERGIEYNPDNLVFCTRKGTYIYPRNFTKMWSENLRSMGIDHKRFHDLRHTVATVMLEDGEAMNTVQEQLGHYDAGFTASRYGHVTAKMRNSAAVKLGERLEKVRNPEAEDEEDANSVKKEDTVIPFQEGRKLKSAACKIK